VASSIFLSIIIPAYNNPHELEGLCQSISYQLIENIEVIVIDDASKIPLKSLVEKFSFKYIYKENSGPAASRNLGASLAKGKYLLFLDSDTVMPEGMLDKILLIGKEEDLDICSIFYSEKSNNPGVGQQFKAYFDYFYNCYNKPEGETLSLQGSSCLFKKNVFKELGGWAENFEEPTIENEEFAFRIEKQGKYKIIYKPNLNISHNFQDLKGLLKTIFRRSIIWTQLKLSKTVGFDGLVRTKLTAFYTLQSIFLIFLSILSPFYFLNKYLFLICLLIYIFGNFKFYLFLHEKCDLLNFLKYAFAQYLFHLFVSTGAIIGVLTFKAHKFKY
tara:strand:+ start:56 stop:1045 length:990 start_codon:yes stop_codon:yes gene_type:complete